MNISDKSKDQLIDEVVRYRELFDNAPFAYQSLNENGEIAEVNNAWCRILGYDRDEVIGRPFADFLHPDYQAVFQERFPQFKKTGEVYDREFRMVRKDGSEVEVSFDGRIATLDDGSFKRTHCVMHDITEKKRTYRELTGIIDNSATVIYVVDTDMRIRMVNKLWQDLFNLTEEEVVGRRVQDVLPGEMGEAFAQSNQRVFDSGQPVELEERADVGGQERTYLSFKFLLCDSAGQPYALCGIARDITERKRAESEILLHKNQVDALFDTVSLPIFAKDSEGRYTHVNSAFCELLGVTPGDVIGKTVEECWPVEDAAVYHQKDMELMRSGGKQTYEHRMSKANGEPHDLILNKSCIVDDEGNVTGLIGSFFDITDRVQAEETLRRSESQYRSLFDNMQDAFAVHKIVCDIDGRPMDYIFLEVNQAFEEQTGLKRGDVVGRPVTEVIPGIKDDPAGWIERYGKVALEGTSERFEHYAEPLQKWYSVVAYCPRPGQFATVFTDVTDRRDMDWALRQSEARFRGAFENAPIGIALFGTDVKFMSCNSAVSNILGYSADELGGMSFVDITHPDDRQSSLERFSRCLASGEDAYAVDKRYLHKDGRIVYGHLGVSIVRDIHGAPSYGVAQLMDITDRKQMEEALRVSEERFRGVFENAPICIALFDAEGTVKSVNDAGSTILGYTADEVIGQSYLKLVHPDEQQESIDTLREKLSSGVNQYTSERRMVHKDGHPVETILGVSLVRDADGVLDFGIAQVADISKLKQMEKALRASEERLSIAGQLSYDLIYEWDVRTDALRWCGDVDGLLGYARWEISRDINAWLDLIHPDDRGQLADAVERHRTATERIQYNYRIRQKDGEYRHWQDQGLPLLDSDGRPYRWVGVCTDVSERKLMEESLRAERDRAQQYFDVAGVMMIALDTDGIVTEINARGCEILGAGPSDIVGMNWFENFLPKDRVGEVSAVFDRIISGDIEPVEYYENEIVRPDGNKRLVAWHNSIVRNATGQIIGLFSSGEDITERKRAEEALRESEERLAKYISYAPDGIFVSDRQGRFVDVNQAACDITGYDRSELIGMTVGHLTHPESQATSAANFQRVLSEGEFQSEEMSRRKDGKTIWVSIKAVLLSDDRIMAFISDITGRKCSEAALIESEKRYHELFSSVMEGIGIVDVDETIRYANPAMVRIFGERSIESMLGKNLLDYFSEEQREKIRNETKRRKRGKPSRYELEFDAGGGKTKYLHVSITPRFDGNGQYVGAFGTVLDISETRRLKDLESRAERLEMAGTIAGQVAHDFNNLLAPMMAYPELIRDTLDPDHKILTFVNAMEDAAAKMTEINQDLLTMGRRGHYTQQVMDLNKVVAQTARELAVRADDVTVEVNLAEDLMEIRGGGAQIHRLVTNILVNACDAIDEDGQITITTENCYVDDTSLAFGRVPRGEYVCLSVADDGCGIPEEIKQRIFDPFFSTKKADKKRGSGLGLGVVDAVMKDHNGYLDLHSEVGRGTTFYLYFPVHRDELAEEESIEVEGGAESLLVVDDDSVQRDVTSQLLNRLGYRVAVVDSGEAAIEYLKKNKRDLVVLDMIMPGGMDGTETYEKILEIVPDQKAIILSGFSDSEKVSRAQELGAGEFVCKPVTRDVLAAAVRKELKRERQPITA